MLIALYDMKIYEELRSVSSIGNTFAFRFTKRLMDEYGTSRRNADIAVSFWCVCYGKNVLHKPCEVLLLDENDTSSQANNIERPKTTAYKDLFTYKKIDFGYSVTGFIGENKNTIVFQSQYSGQPVIEIGNESFSDSEVQEIIVAEGCKRIGEKAFRNSAQLSQAILPMSLVEIGGYAFGGCEKLKTLSLSVNLKQIGEYAFASTPIKAITFPSELYWIGEGAFSGCEGLSKVAFHKEIVRISDKCCLGCTSLSRVEIDNGIEAIGLDAFMECKSLLQLTVPDSVTEIGEGAFAGVHSDFVLQCSMGSYAETYARKHKLKYQLI